MPEIGQWTQLLSSILAIYPNGCAKPLRGLAERQVLLSNVLLSCPITPVRDAVIDLMFETLLGLQD
ncbi:hypothetical protein BGZ65_011729, partial [Modicella reniformis]